MILLLFCADSQYIFRNVIKVSAPGLDISIKNKCRFVFAQFYKKGKNEESDLIMKQAVDNSNTMELHQYGRQLLNEKKVNEAMTVFEKNYIKNKGAWPTNVGMMRAHSALGNIKKALEFAREALKQAPDDINKKNLENAIKTLESGKAL